RRPRDRHRAPLDQLERLRASLDPVRRLQAVRRRARAWTGRARALHGREERLLLDRGPLMAGRLEGKVCVITGAASGIGAESARLFAVEGARVVGVDISPGAVGELAIEADVTDEAQVRDMYDRTKAE